MIKNIRMGFNYKLSFYITIFFLLFSFVSISDVLAECNDGFLSIINPRCTWCPGYTEDEGVCIFTIYATNCVSGASSAFRQVMNEHGSGCDTCATPGDPGCSSSCTADTEDCHTCPDGSEVCMPYCSYVSSSFDSSCPAGSPYCANTVTGVDCGGGGGGGGCISVCDPLIAPTICLGYSYPDNCYNNVCLGSKNCGTLTATLTATPNSVIVGQTSNLSVLVGGTATGPIFYSGQDCGANGTVSNINSVTGAFSCSYSIVGPTPTRTVSIRVSRNGLTKFVTTNITVNYTPITTTLSAVPNNIIIGQTSNLTVSLTGTVPPGTVDPNFRFPDCGVDGAVSNWDYDTGSFTCSYTSSGVKTATINIVWGPSNTNPTTNIKVITNCTPCPDPSTYCPGQSVQDGCGNACPAIPGTKICDPGPPTGFGHSGNTINTITWSWTKPLYDPNSNGYWGTPTKYQLFDSFGNLIADNIPTTACSGSNCSWQEISLSANTSYARYAKACNQTVCSVPSNTASAYTSIQPVVSLLCTSIGLNSIQVTAYSASGLGFSNLTSGSSGIRFQRPGFDAGYLQSNIYVFSSLSPSTAYTFTAGPSRNGDNESAAGTANVTCSTVATLPAPANLHHTANTVNTIDWAWNAVAGATTYNIYSRYFSNSNPYWQLRTTISAPAVTYHQTHYYAGSSYGWWALTENVMYGTGVAACNAVSGCSSIATADAATSILPPSDIACSSITKTSMTAFAVGSLSNSGVGNSGIVFRRLTPPSSQDSQSRYWYLLGLMPETSYSFYAKARNQDGELSAEFGPKLCSTLAPTIIPYSLRIYGPSNSILKLALIEVEDALLLSRGNVKTRMPWGTNYSAYLVEPTDPNASPVRVMTPYGIKSWRKAP